TGPAGTLSGTVRNQFGSPVPAATVTAGVYETITAADGTYGLSLPPATYTVSAGKLHYTGQTFANVQIAADSTTTRDFTLSGNPPAAVTAFTATPDNTSIMLQWKNPPSGNFGG